VAGQSRPKDGVLAHVYVPAIHALQVNRKDVDARDKRGHDACCLRVRAFSRSSPRKRGPRLQITGFMTLDSRLRGNER